jgi:tetratricopeptide (TPR) repeat protein
MATSEYPFDVFLSHNSRDKPTVSDLAKALEQRGLRVWLDKDQLPPGKLYQPELQKGIRESASVAVFIGKDGISPWEDIEKQAAMNFAVHDQRPLIPVLLPDAPDETSASLDSFLALYTWVDFRPAVTVDKLDRLEWGITGRKPEPDRLGLKDRVGLTRTIHSDQLPTVAGKFFGREAELKLLDEAFDGNGIHIVQFVAAGGTGKTKLLREWLDRRDQDIAALIAWSFYSQGSSEDKQVSATPFFTHAFAKLGSDKTRFDTEEQKGEHLADLLKKYRCLLVLDGLEPMQHAGRGMRGELKDRAIRALLRNLASGGSGLCIVTTRLELPELKDRAHVVSRDLHNLTPGDGVSLLRSLGVKGSDKEMFKTVAEYGCHALALHLLGNAIKTFLDGEVSRRDQLPELIEPEQYDNLDPVSLHAFKVMQAYQDWFKDEQGHDLAELRLLYLLGLFDHPIETEVLQLLWREPIVGLTVWEGTVLPAGDAKTPWSPKAGWFHKLTDWIPMRRNVMDHRIALTEPQWQTAIAALHDDHHLLAKHKNKPGLLDCHPLIREYFGRRLKRDNPEAWRQAHARLYDNYKALPKKQLPETLEEMQPLFHAVAHGCAAGMHQRALDEVYWPRVLRKADHYLPKKLGMYSDHLATVAHFFDSPWQTPAVGLSEEDQAAALNWAGIGLSALGRLREAVEPMQANIKMSIQQENWVEAAKGANNLSEFQLCLGEIPVAITSAQLSVEYADKTEDKSQSMCTRTTLADALHQAADLTAAQKLFEEAERLQLEFQPESWHLYSLWGFRYCDLLLAMGETGEVLDRAGQSLKWATVEDFLLDIALDQLSLGRAYLQLEVEGRNKSVLSEVERLASTGVSGETTNRILHPNQQKTTTLPIDSGLAPEELQNRGDSSFLKLAEYWLSLAVAGLQSAGAQHHLPRGLLARAAYFRHTLAFPQAHQDLQEVFDLAEPSGMLLHLTDAHLESARLALAELDALYSPCSTTNELVGAGCEPAPTRPPWHLGSGNPCRNDEGNPNSTSSDEMAKLLQTARYHTDEAAELIAQTGYKRRLPELEALKKRLDY